MDLAPRPADPRSHLPFYRERVDLACALRWTARLGMHEAVANHIRSLSMRTAAAF